MPDVSIFGRAQFAAKGFLEGTHRTRSPRETLDAYMPHMPAMGITRLADVTGLDYIGLPVYLAVRPNSRSVSVSQGKGISADSAKASALMESIEIWHAEYINKPLRVESYTQMKSEAQVLDIADLPRKRWVNLEPVHPCTWIEGFDLLSGTPRWVPYEVVSLNYVLPDDHRPVFYCSSIGLASGNHLLEAVIHGLCEVVERDAIALWESSDDVRILCAFGFSNYSLVRTSTSRSGI
jgi:ribosomal protein S12 methylthiotransferase accessory factor